MKHVNFTLMVLALAGMAFGSDAPTDQPKKSEADLLYEKLLTENTKPAETTYAAYQKALDVANVKVVKALEAAKADFNDPKKGKLSITERAAAIAAIDDKIKAVKDGAIGETVIDRSKKTYAEVMSVKVDMAKAIIGKWKIDMKPLVGTIEFMKGGVATFNGNDVNSNSVNHTEFTWNQEGSKIVCDVNGRGKEFLYITSISDSLFSGSAWCNPTVTGDKIKK
jgi:hypothetical protein